MTNPPARQRGVKSVDMAIRLLRIVQESGQPMMLRDLAEQAGITPAQAHSYMNSLKRTGMIAQETAAGRYGLSESTLALAQTVLRGDPVLRQTLERARALSVRLGMMVTVERLIRDVPTTICVIKGPRPLSLSLSPGMRSAASNSAAAHLFDAWRSTPEMGHARARSIREAGFTHAVGMPVPHLCSLAAAVMTPAGPCAAVSVIGYPEAVSPDQNSPTLRALLEATRRYESALA